MKSHISLFAGAAAGVFAVGAVTGWMAPSVLRSAHAESVSGDVAAPPAPAAAPAPIPLGSAPNYRAIVAQNRAAVVGITTAGEMNVASRAGTRRDALRLWQRR